MVARCLFSVLAVFLWAVSVSAGELNASKVIRLAKYEEGNVLRHRNREVSPQVEVKEKTDFYDIDGATTDDLRGQMKRNGTKWNDGKVYAALTTWDIRYDYDIASVDGRYCIKGIKTEVDIVYHLPRLVPSAKTPEQLVALWKVYAEKLTGHEVGHRDIAVATGREIYQALASIGSSDSRGDLDRKAKSVVKAKLQRLKEIQVEYDTETSHGAKQGAVLPSFPAA